MADSIDVNSLVPSARAFLTDLAENNTRDWFNDNKPTYDIDLKRPAEVLISQVTGILQADYGQVRGKLFRPQRDVRFSADKTPYHAHLHMLWSLPDGRGWFFAISPTYVTAGAGVMSFDPDRLEAFREAVAGAPGAELAAILHNGNWRLDPPELKRVPAPFEVDHPQEALLRRKGLVAWDDSVANSAEQDPLATLDACFGRLGALQKWFGEHIA